MWWFFFKFEKPGRRDDFDYPEMSKESVGLALKDANISYDKVEQAVVGYVYGKNPLHCLGSKGVGGLPSKNFWPISLNWKRKGSSSALYCLVA